MFAIGTTRVFLESTLYFFIDSFIRRETPEPIPTSKSETAFYHMYCLSRETWVESRNWK